MKKPLDTATMMAEFLAKGGQVTKVDAGVRAIESDRTIYNAIRNGAKAVADDVAMCRASEQRYHRQHDAATEARMNGHRVTGFDGDDVMIERNGKSERY
jgi:hypothetical protein